MKTILTPLDIGSRTYEDIMLLLEKAGVTFHVNFLKDGMPYTILEVDEEKLRSTVTRKAGRKKKRLQDKYDLAIVPVSVIKKMIEENGMKKTAESLSISETTLYRRLKDAEKHGDDFIF